MREYIDRQATFDAFYKSTCDGDAIERAECVLRSIPIADVVEVVRCKDCKHYDLAPNGFNGMCNRQYATFYAVDFCSYGEQKGENI